MRSNRFNKVASAVAAALLTLSSINTYANDALEDISLEDLLSIEISVASNVITDARKQPVSVSTIGNDKIKLSGARTLNELLTIYVPGYFTVEDQDDTIAGFRGLVPDNNSKVMLLLNGENLNTEWFWGPPDAILNGIDLSFIERVEVIRGPGSVTLGQGALLGVVNIVTKKAFENSALVQVTQGGNGYTKESMVVQFVKEDTKAWIYAANGDHDGEALPNVGWAAGRSDQGLTVYERNHHLHRAEFTNFVANVQHKEVELNLFHFEQLRDLYNFYRDRESVEQRLDGLSLKYKKELSETLRMTLSGKYIQDDYALFSHGNNLPVTSRYDYESSGSGFSDIINSVPGLADSIVEPGLTMGGTRETRKGFKVLFNYDWSENNKMAFGAEYSNFKMGQQDRRGNNFIINEEIQRLGLGSDGAGGFQSNGSVNDNNTWVKPYDFNMKSIFFEDFWTLSDSLDVFGALRWDDHPDWGSHISPRLGMLYDIDNTHLFRFTWQTGFRGAVGVQFAGGFVQDGFLAEENFDDVNAIATTYADFNWNGNAADDTGELKQVEPETIESLEFAYTYTKDNLKVNAVVFHNTVEDILTAQAHGYAGIGFGEQVGTDDIGTWNGHWYYQNQSGQLKQLGFEVELDYQINDWMLSASHANVGIASADAGTIGVYVLPGEKTAAYPENVTRLQATYNADTSVGQFAFHINDLYYWEYEAPTGVNVDGTEVVNMGVSWTPSSMQNLNVEFVMKNVFDTDTLYPLNGTGNLAGADGAPAIEGQTWWVNFTYTF